MHFIKRILSLFKEPKKHSLYYSYSRNVNFLYFRQRDNLAVYKAYPGLEATLQDMCGSYKRHSVSQYFILKQDRLSSLQNLCDAVGVILYCEDIK